MRVRLRLVAVVLALLVPALVLARWTLAAGAPGEPIPPPSYTVSIAPLSSDERTGCR